MESWRLVWRNGFLPNIPTEALRELHAAVITDDPRLIQGGTTLPPPLVSVQDWPCEAGCAIGFCGMQLVGDGATVGAVEEIFARTCYECDQLMGEPAACRWFLNWFDDTPRPEMRRLFGEELAANLAELASRATSAA